MRLLVIALLSISAALSVGASPYTMNPDSVYKHIAVLASDSLEGRETGEPGEWKAAQYIISVFKNAGLKPLGESGSWLQPFEFTRSISPGPKTTLKVNSRDLKLDSDFQPLPQSGSLRFSFTEVVPAGYGIVSEDSAYNDYSGLDVAGKAVLVKRFSPDPQSNPHVDFDKYSSFSDKIAAAITRKAAAVLFYTPPGQDDTLPFTGVTHVTPQAIPIIFLRQAAIRQLGLDSTAPALTSIIGETEMIRVRDTGYNVIGYLPAKSDTTVILGAHYDHLGWGGAASRYQGGERQIHHGADDNGSGTSGLLELARYYGSRQDQLHHSLLFTAFSGEEKGILGSNYYAKHMTIDSTRVLMMLNMDMVGRLKDQENGLAVVGVGTAAEFKPYFDSLKIDSLKLTFRESAATPSDHTAFYNLGIPTLHFFTGAHEDYHKPSDVVERIDTKGITKVAELVAAIVDHFDQTCGLLTFQKTKDPDAGKQRASFKVTLGIMPDYTAEVKGVKVDGVSADKPAEKAGILKGDLIIRMGDYPIEDMYNYMSALGKFRKGDSARVQIVRGTDTLSVNVVF